MIPHLIQQLAPHGVQITLWPCQAGYQANVKEQGASGWTVGIAADPLEALTTALKQRVCRVPDRRIVVTPAEPEQIDIEEAIAAAGVEDDGFGDLV